MAEVGLYAKDLQQFQSALVAAVKVGDKEQMNAVVAEALKVGIEPEALAHFSFRLRRSKEQLFAFDVIKAWFHKGLHDDFVLTVAKNMLSPACEDDIWYWLECGGVPSFSSDFPSDCSDDAWQSEGFSSVLEENGDLNDLILNADYDMM